MRDDLQPSGTDDERLILELVGTYVQLLDFRIESRALHSQPCIFHFQT